MQNAECRMKNGPHPGPLPSDGRGRTSSRSLANPALDSGFTLVEIMIVVAIIGIFAAAGLPSIIKLVSPNPLRKAVTDVVEGCSHARAQAILQGRPMEFVITADGAMSVRAAPERTESQSGSTLSFSTPAPAPVAETHNFSAHLHQDVAISLLDVNFVDHMQAENATVRFFPNGTCDDFTVVLEWDGGIRKVSTEVVTGLTDTVVMR